MHRFLRLHCTQIILCEGMLLDTMLLDEAGNGESSPVEPPPLACAHLPWIQFAVLVLLAVYAACVSQLADTFDAEFFERDPTQSYRFDSDTVPTSALVAIALLVPSAVFVAFFFLILKKGDSINLVSLHIQEGAGHYYVLVWCILGLLLCLVGEICLVETVKCLVGAVSVYQCISVSVYQCGGWDGGDRSADGDSVGSLLSSSPPLSVTHTH
jgi:hypothetical protein